MISGSFSALGLGVLFNPWEITVSIVREYGDLAMPRAAKKAASTTFKNFEPYKPKRGEEYMSDKQSEHFMQILHHWKSELMQEVDRTRV